MKIEDMEKIAADINRDWEPFESPWIKDNQLLIACNVIPGLTMIENNLTKLIAIAKLSKKAVNIMICTCSIADCGRCDLVKAIEDLEAE